MNTFRPYPKPKRLESKETIEHVRSKRDGCCLMGMYNLHGPCSDGLDVHHITSRGAGGNDTAFNLITLCRRHHNMAHEHKIKKEELRHIVQKVDNYRRTNLTD